MIVGVYIKNFKCYQGTQFIPIFANEENKLIAFLGDNGVGKSGILESLDVFFSSSNRPKWLRNKDAKTGEQNCFVAPVFLIDKNKIKTDLSKFQKSLRTDVNEINFNEEAKCLVCVTRREDGSFTLFDGKKEFLQDSEKKIALELFKKINDLYQFVYIESEVDIDEETRINSKIYEMIAGSSIIDAVEQKFKENDEKSILVNKLNETLSTIIDEKLVSKLQQIDSHYTYVGTKGALSKLSNKILAKVSTEAFLNSKKIKYKGKQLEDLSSGQRRTALLDFITALLENKIFDGKKEIIFAIDEPEISLDTSKKIGQFEKLLKIAKSGTSIMFSSHWYGWISTFGMGRSILIEDIESDKQITKYENSEFPFRDIPKYEMRMIFDFLMSLGATAESNKSKKYIICEGITDSLILSASLNDDSYKIIPVGKGQVKKIADIFKSYYWKDSGNPIKNVLFLIDTDPEQKFDYSNSFLKRWSRDKDFNFTLIDGNNNFQFKCEIENILECNILLEALKEVFPNEVIIQGLEILHPSIPGIDAFGMSAVTLSQFDKITKVEKVQLAKKYVTLLISSKKEQNLIKDLILDAF